MRTRLALLGVAATLALSGCSSDPTLYTDAAGGTWTCHPAGQGIGGWVRLSCPDTEATGLARHGDFGASYLIALGNSDHEVRFYDEYLPDRANPVGYREISR